MILRLDGYKKGRWYKIAYIDTHGREITHKEAVAIKGVAKSMFPEYERVALYRIDPIRNPLIYIDFHLSRLYNRVIDILDLLD